MLNYYQPFLLPFIGRKRHLPPDGVKQFFYHSFEDGLWQLLSEKKITKGSTILVPDFYCVDVLENIVNHGYQWQMYSLDSNFQIDSALLLQIIKKTKPAVIVIFHACGITSNLLENTSWLKKIDSEILIIEDSVHRLVNPEEVKIIDSRHFVMDSLRKDSPLSGSFLYGLASSLTFSPARPQLFSRYQVSSSLKFLLFRFCLQLAFIGRWGKGVVFCHKKLLKQHDDIIGHSPTAHGGLPWIPYLHQFLNFAKLSQVKNTQVRLYQELVTKHLATHDNFIQIDIPVEDYGKLHVYPLVYKNVDHRLEKWLEQHNMPIWFKFPDCPWSHKRGVLFLPLGFHVTVEEIQAVVELLAKFK